MRSLCFSSSHLNLSCSVPRDKALSMHCMGVTGETELEWKWFTIDFRNLNSMIFHRASILLILDYLCLVSYLKCVCWLGRQKRKLGSNSGRAWWAAEEATNFAQTQPHTVHFVFKLAGIKLLIWSVERKSSKP